jgi:hypothetical protein
VLRAIAGLISVLPPTMHADVVRKRETSMVDLVDIAIPTNAQIAAEALGLKVHRSVTTGARIRRIPRDEAEIAIECLRDWGFSGRIVEDGPHNSDASERDAA